MNAGGATCPGATPPDPGIADVCPLLSERGGLVVMLDLWTAESRALRCNSAGWYFRSSSPRGSDLPSILDEIATRILRVAGPPSTPTATMGTPAGASPTPADSPTAAPSATPPSRPVTPPPPIEAPAGRLWLPWVIDGDNDSGG